MSRLLIINSKDRRTGTSTNFDILLQQNVTNFNGSHPTKIKLIGFQFSNAIYNVNSNNKNIAFTETTGGTVNITLTEGVYTASTLATHLASVMTSNTGVSNTYTGSYDSTTMKITITANTQTFKFNADYKLIGFLSSQSAALSLTGTYPPKILIDYLIIESPNFETFLASFSNTGSFFVPLGNIDIQNVGYIGKNNIPGITHNFKYNNNLKFTITDPDGNVINNNNYDIIMLFEIE